jgi:hypothetical protein
MPIGTINNVNRQGGKRRQSVNEKDVFRSYRRCDEISDGEAERECLSELARERGDDRDECRIPSDRSALMWRNVACARACVRACVHDEQRVQICGGTKLCRAAIQCKHRDNGAPATAGAAPGRRTPASEGTMPNAYQTVLYDAVTVGRTIGR